MSGGNITVQRTGQGIPVITETIDDCRISGYMVAVGTGSRDEAVGEWGISHLLEHSVFRAAGDRSSFQMSKEIEGAGGELNAFTGKELTAFYGMTIKGAESIAKSIVADIVCDPLLKPEDVEMEKKIVIQEIGMGENDTSSYIHTLFSETMWGSSELGHYVAGSVESVGRMDDTCLRRYYSDKYVGSNIAVFACGAVDPSDALEWAEEHFDALPKGVPNKRTVSKASSIFPFQKASAPSSLHPARSFASILPWQTPWSHTFHTHEPQETGDTLMKKLFVFALTLSLLVLSLACA